MIIPDRKQCSWPKHSEKRADYGERKRKRDQKRFPLFAEDPTIIRTAEDYQQRMDAGIRESARRYRQRTARDWRAIRRWLRATTPEKRDAWFERWNRHWSLPHDAATAVSLAFRLDHPETSPVPKSWQDWKERWSR